MIFNKKGVYQLESQLRVANGGGGTNFYTEWPE